MGKNKKKKSQPWTRSEKLTLVSMIITIIIELLNFFFK